MNAQEPQTQESNGFIDTAFKSVTLDKIPKVMKDLAYLTGMVFSTFLDHKLRSVDKKKTKEDIVN